MIFSLGARRWNGLKTRPTAARTVSKHSFNFTSEDRIERLKQVKLKKNSEAKVDWAVSAYIDWRDEHLTNFHYDAPIYFANLLELETLEKNNLNHALCRFIPEVTRKRGEGPYPGATLYQMIVAIQRYLFVNKIRWKMLDDPEFEDMCTVLDNVMRERTAQNIGVVKKQAGLITYEHENCLWEKGILGEESPDKLRNTVLFLLGINCYLRAVEDHYNLRRDTEIEKGQIQFKANPRGVKCIVYQEDSVTKTHDGGLNDMRRDRKIVWVYPNVDNVNRCPVRLIEKYLGLCPKVKKRANFYLQSLQKPTPTQWYSNQVVGENSIGKVVKTLMADANIEGYFTNHSTRRTGSTRLFRAGVDRKLIKEATGHSSDAIDKYQVTSDEQREAMCKIIAGNHGQEVTKDTESVSVSKETNSKCQCQDAKIDVNNVGGIINEIIQKQKGSGKSTIKIQIEITTE